MFAVCLRVGGSSAPLRSGCLPLGSFQYDRNSASLLHSRVSGASRFRVTAMHRLLLARMTGVVLWRNSFRPLCLPICVGGVRVFACSAGLYSSMSVFPGLSGSPTCSSVTRAGCFVLGHRWPGFRTEPLHFPPMFVSAFVVALTTSRAPPPLTIQPLLPDSAVCVQGSPSSTGLRGSTVSLVLSSSSTCVSESLRGWRGDRPRTPEASSLVRLLFFHRNPLDSWHKKTNKNNTTYMCVCLPVCLPAVPPHSTYCCS